MNTPTEKRHAWMLIGCFFFQQLAISGLMFGPLSLFAEPICAAWGIMRSQFAVVITLGALLNGVISMTCYGYLEKKLGLKKLMFVGGVLCVGGFLLIALANGLTLFYIGGTSFGIGAAFLSNNTINTAIIRRFAMHQGRMLGIVRMISGVVSTAGSFLVGLWITTASIGWKGALWIIFALGVICFIAWTLLYKGDPEDLGERPMYYAEFNKQMGEPADTDDYEYGMSAKEAWRSPRFWMLGVTYLIIGFTEYAVLSILALCASDYGLGDISGMLLSLVYLAYAVVALFAGWMCDKWGSKSFIALGSACIVAASFILMAPESNELVLVIVAILLGVGYVMAGVPSGISVREAFGTKEYGSKVGLATGAQILGTSFAPVIMNLFFDFGGHTYALGFWVTIVLCVVSTIMCFIFTRPAWKQSE